MQVNPSNVQAQVIVDELARNGVRQVVMCAGGYTIPVAAALYRAAKAGRIELHVRIDERSAGFLANGLAMAGGAPAALVCTAGTAVANFHPAVLEAAHTGTGLIVLTTDTVPELHGTGASQTIDQSGAFGTAAVRMDFPVAERRPGQNAPWRGLVCRAVAQARAGRPVQLNVAFRELLPRQDTTWSDSFEGRPDDQPWTSTAPRLRPDGGQIDFRLPARTLMVVGTGDRDRTAAAAKVAAAAGWPVIAEPMAEAAVLAAGATVLRCGFLLLGSGELPTGPHLLPPSLKPEAIVVVGRPTLTRTDIPDGCQDVPVHRIGDHAQWTDPRHNATHARDWLGSADLGRVEDADPAWLAEWTRFDTSVASVLDKHVDDADWPTGLQVARDLMTLLPQDAVFYLGASNSVRDVARFAEARPDLDVYSNRGVSGIDGNVSTAIGVALAAGRQAYALMGDLTFLHDTNGLLLGPDEPRPDLTVVVVNNRGGGIYSLLVEHDTPEDAAGFERVFGTPHVSDLAGLCAAHQVPYARVTDRDGLRRAVAPAPGLRVVEVPTADRGMLLDLHTRIHGSVNDVLQLMA